MWSLREITRVQRRKVVTATGEGLVWEATVKMFWTVRSSVGSRGTSYKDIKKRGNVSSDEDNAQQNRIAAEHIIHCSACLSPVKFEWYIQPFLPWEPLLWFLFTWVIIVTSVTLHAVILHLLFLLMMLFCIGFHHFRRWLGFIPAGAPFQRWIIGIGSMDLIPFLQKIINLKKAIRSRNVVGIGKWLLLLLQQQTYSPKKVKVDYTWKVDNTACISCVYLLVISVNLVKTWKSKCLRMISFVNTNIKEEYDGDKRIQDNSSTYLPILWLKFGKFSSFCEYLCLNIS